MAKLADFKAVLAEVDTETNRIADKLEELVGELSDMGMTGEEESDVLDDLQALADRLKEIGADPENPVPPVEDPEA